MQSFLWKLCKNVLPTQDNLVRRKIYSSCGCAICEDGQETTMHVLKDCLYAKKVWACCGWKVPGLELSWENPIDWVWLIWYKNGDDGLMRFTSMAWNMWNVRNSGIFRGVVKMSTVLCRDAERYKQEYAAAHILLGSPPKHGPRRSICWKPPEWGLTG